MIEGHGHAQTPIGRRLGGTAAIRQVLGDQPRFVEQFVAFEHLVGVPPGISEPETDLHPLAALRVVPRPFQQRRLDFVHDHGSARPPVFPREIGIAVLPTGILRLGQVPFAHQRKVTHGQDPAAAGAFPGVASLVGERIKLLHVPEFAPGLLQDRTAHAQFQRAVVLFVEGPERQCARHVAGRHC